MKEHFEVSGFNNDRKASLNSNVISCIRNNFIGALSAQPTLPKFVVVVPDNDIIKYFLYKDEHDMQERYARLLKWLMCQYDRMVSSQKEYLTPKSKRANEPYFVWIKPPMHESIHSKELRLREMFKKALDNCTSMHQNTFALQLKKMWDPSDKLLYNREERRFTANGLILYWQAVDKTVKYANTLLLKKKHQKTTPNDTPHHQRHSFHDNDKYHWRKPSHTHRDRRH